MVLRNRLADFFERYGIWILIVPPLAMLVAPAIILFSFVEPAKVAEFYAELIERDTLLDLILPTLLIAPVMFAVFKISAQSRVELTDTGIRFVSGTPEWISRHTDWELRWEEMEAVELQRPPLGHPLNSVVLFKSGGRQRRLQPWQWVAPGAEKTKLGHTFLGRGKKLHALIEATALVTELRARGKLAQADTGEQPAGANDLRNAGKASMIVALAFVAAVTYFILDSVIGLQEYYAGATPWQWHFAVGLMAAVVVWLALNQEKPGTAEPLLVALIFGGGMAMAAHPGLLRVNAWMDQDGLANYEYTLGQGDTWSTSAEPPDLVFDIGSGYWKQYETGAVKTFQIRLGGLGFYQINMAPIYQEQKAFYASRDAQPSG